MLPLSLSALQAYRARTFRTAPGTRVASAEEAVDFVNQRGFTFFWPIKGIDLPSLWAAAAGDRPVPDEHDDPGHVTWDWKDSLLGQRRWYYGRALRHRNAMISLACAPYFYALSPNYGDPENDYLEQYRQGILTAEAKAIYEALLKEGPLDTISLRKAAHLSNPGSDGRFNKALDDLQMEFKLLPVGISQAGAWRYAFIYDLTHRHFPDLIAQAGPIFEADARHHLARQYLLSVGAIPSAQIGRLFGCKAENADRVIKPFLSSGEWITLTHPQQTQAWVGLPQLAESSAAPQE